MDNLIKALPNLSSQQLVEAINSLTSFGNSNNRSYDDFISSVRAIQACNAQLEAVKATEFSYNF